MGVVYEAWSEALGCPVALKVVPPEALIDADAVERIEREAAAQARLRHPNIVKILDLGRIRGCPWLAMELVRGESLEARLRRQGPLPQRQAAAWAHALAGALAHAHALGVIHRDLKPANVLLGPDEAPLLTDFGLARIADDPRRLTATGSLLGSPAWMAPEQALGDPRAVDARTDVYGLGAVLYHMLTGTAPHAGRSQLEVLEAVVTRDPEPASRRRRDLDPALEAICARCLARDREARWGSMTELAAALERWMSGRPSRSGVPAGAVAVGLAVLAAGLLAALVLIEPPPRGSGIDAPEPAPPAPPAPAPAPAPPDRDLPAGLRARLEGPPTCEALLEAAALARAAGTDPAGDLAGLAPEHRSRLRFGLHLQAATVDPDALLLPSPPLRRLARDPAATTPWAELAREIVALEGVFDSERLERAGASLDRSLPRPWRVAWVPLVRASLLYPRWDPARLERVGELVDRALELDPGCWLADLLRARCELAGGRDDGAARARLERLLTAAPRPAPLALRVAWLQLLLGAGELEEARDALDELGPGPLPAWAAYYGIELQLARGQYDPALRAAEDLLSRPDLHDLVAWNARVARGQALLRLDRCEAAAECYRALLEQGQAEGRTHSIPLQGWVSAMLRLGRGRELLDRIATLRLADPVREALSRQIEALVREQEARQVPPGASAEELERRADARLAREDWEGALPALDALLALRPPKLRQAHLDRAIASFHLGRFAEAVEHLERAARLQPLEPDALTCLARALAGQGLCERASQVFAQVAALDPGDRSARPWLVRMLIEAGDLDGAERELAELRRRARGTAEEAQVAWATATLRRRQGRHREALEALRAIPPELVGDRDAPVLRRHHDPLRRYLERRLARER